MRIQSLAIANYATIDQGGKPVIAGIYNHVEIKKNQSDLFGYVWVDVIEISKPERLFFRIKLDNKDYIEPVPFTVNVGETKRHHIIINISDINGLSLKYEKKGIYFFEVWHKNKKLASTEVLVEDK